MSKCTSCITTIPKTSGKQWTECFLTGVIERRNWSGIGVGLRVSHWQQSRPSPPRVRLRRRPKAKWHQARRQTGGLDAAMGLNLTKSAKDWHGGSRIWLVRISARRASCVHYDRPVLTREPGMYRVPIIRVRQRERTSAFRYKSEF